MNTLDVPYRPRGRPRSPGSSRISGITRYTASATRFEDSGAGTAVEAGAGGLVTVRDGGGAVGGDDRRMMASFSSATPAGFMITRSWTRSASTLPVKNV